MPPFRRVTTLDETWLELRLALSTLADRGRLRSARPRFPELFGDVDRYCVFIGYPRSGHSLIGSMLDAHPQTAVAHRLDSLRYLQAGYDIADVFYLILRNAQRFAATGRSLTGYSYRIDGQWQGRYESLRLLSDQEGDKSVRRLRDDPGLLDRLYSQGVRVRFLHVVRNPYDNITTVAIRTFRRLSAAIDRYFDLCSAVADVKARAAAGDVIDVRHEDFIDDPETHLRALEQALGLPSEEEHVRGCARVVHRTPHRSRYRLPWSTALIDTVRRRAEAYPFLQGYAYDEQGS
jgi:hypothetical protein